MTPLFIKIENVVYNVNTIRWIQLPEIDSKYGSICVGIGREGKNITVDVEGETLESLLGALRQREALVNLDPISYTSRGT